MHHLSSSMNFKIRCNCFWVTDGLSNPFTFSPPLDFYPNTRNIMITLTLVAGCLDSCRLHPRAIICYLGCLCVWGCLIDDAGKRRLGGRATWRLSCLLGSWCISCPRKPTSCVFRSCALLSHHFHQVRYKCIDHRASTTRHGLVQNLYRPPSVIVARLLVRHTYWALITILQIFLDAYFSACA